MTTILQKILSGDGITPAHHNIIEPDKCLACSHNHFVAVMEGWQCEVCGAVVPFANATSTAAIQGVEEEKEEVKTQDVYNLDFHGHKLDPYRIGKLYGLDPIQLQCLKKLLRKGRKHKTERQDMQEVISSAQAWLELDGEEAQ